MSSLTQSYRRVGLRAFQNAGEQNHQNVVRALEQRGPFPTLLDLGCDDGAHTMKWAAAAGAQTIHGIEVVSERAVLAQALGIIVSDVELGGTTALPFEDKTFDAVVSNQVIEHVFDTDLFLAEAFRVLKPGGVIVTSTENLASWHNVGSLFLGWQPFSLTNVSSTGVVGNPLGLLEGGMTSSLIPDSQTWQHRRVFASRGLVDLHSAHGFVDVECLGAGYYPLPRWVGRLNPGHAVYITVAGQRPR